MRGGGLSGFGAQAAAFSGQPGHGSPADDGGGLDPAQAVMPGMQPMNATQFEAVQYDLAVRCTGAGGVCWPAREDE